MFKRVVIIVSVAVQKLATRARETFKEENLMEILKSGGGASSHGLKEKIPGQKLYDFVVHPFCIGKPHHIRMDVDITFKFRVLFLEENTCKETAASLESSFKNWLLRCLVNRCSIFWNILHLLPIVLAKCSVFLILLFHHLELHFVKWVGCISHPPNTAMKHSIESENEKNPHIFQELANVHT